MSGAEAVSRVGAVAIGRNEGARLIACLDSLQGLGRMVYVDSGSTDGSVAAAEARGAEVVRLDTARPFTAARARNAGLARLREAGPTPDYVQLIYGDCTLDPGWVATALAFLEATPRAAVACGRRRERFPEASIYNRLCDREWNTPVGRARNCGGDALVRMAALEQVGDFRADMIAGEEPELCVRLRKQGWEIWRLDAAMTRHDAGLTRLSQWWTRARRTGHAYAERMALHGGPPLRDGVRGTLNPLAWGLGPPVAALGLGLVHPAGVAVLAVYPLQVLRLARREGGGREGWTVAALTVLGKIPETLGVLHYALARLAHRPARLMEYKGSAGHD